ncbi:hypothetical protein M501DRAFT_995624 [Patellaria atrata CBS 101060]|uniref:HECT-type E3 ubiquitin transferase n=1 Tax=Patellaria atrata CBS 101060 TaxID=1346257 RepID=A0A9P4S7P7_9PEZI|nr:hypothetical protein M501DRAFT_995624 [Patellaria atrata CBS 101060]
MSSRVTRSAARASAGTNSAPTQLTNDPVPDPPPVRSSRKRKASTREPTPPDPSPESPSQPSRKATKRSKVDKPESSVRAPPTQPHPPPAIRSRKGKAAVTMSNAGPSSGPSEETSPAQAIASSSTSKRKSTRKRSNIDNGPSTTTPTSRRSKKSLPKPDEDLEMNDVEDEKHEDSTLKSNEDTFRPHSSDDSGGDDQSHNYPEDEDDNPFESNFLRRATGAGLSSTLRALSGMMSGQHSRLRGILERLKQKDDPSMQLIALQDLSELLLISTEDNLSGQFSPDQYIKELITLMQPNEFGEENPEIMLLACRCIANMMEALPASTGNVVYGGAVPVLCQKLREIHYIDLAEQALSTLEKISVEFPASIVREDGLEACLTYLDFFATGTQRTAVTTAANCCRNIPEDNFDVIKRVMPILQNVLNNSDQRVLEQGCLCVCRIVESFKYQDKKLEELIEPELLRAILRLLLPGTTNLIGPNIHTQFLRVLSITARASPRLSVELFKMNVVDTLYQILTGISPPSGTDDIATKIDTVVIMQALIHRPREQIFETLNVICELLPDIPESELLSLHGTQNFNSLKEENVASSTRSKKSPNDKRIDSLEECKVEVKRFAVILLPTLTDAYSSTVNLSVRQKVLNAQLKMLSNLDVEILGEALRSVPYASYLASILSQRDHHSLVTSALQAAELLLKRMEPIYRYQFYREGVISEILKLAERPLEDLPESKSQTATADFEVLPVEASKRHGNPFEEPTNEEVPSDIHVLNSKIGDDDGEDDEDGQEEHHDDNSESNSDSESDRNIPIPPPIAHIEDVITEQAKKLIEQYESNGDKAPRDRASAILTDLKALAQELREYYRGNGSGEGSILFSRLATYFDGNALESITSYELLTSKVVEVLLEIFSGPDDEVSAEARAAFLEAFMGSRLRSSQKTNSSATLFSVLVHKLQDLLSRAEHFEVITVHQNTFDSNRSSAASMLAKQIRLKLVADEDSGIPRGYRNIMVSIHAIATFKALDDYLRPRISLAERPRGARDRGGMSDAIAAYAAALRERGVFDGRSSSAGSPAALPSDTTNRPNKRTAKSKPPNSSVPTSSLQVASGSVPERSPAVRRSSRRHQSNSQAPPPPPPPPPPLPDTLEAENMGEQLECADEAQLSDEDDMDDDSALDALVDDLENELDEEIPDPSAVSVEVASTGRVTARKEDGTRVATPLQGASASSSHLSPAERFAAMARQSFAQQALASPTSSRTMSYAAAVQAIPQDWHIEFEVNGESISNETTIYRVIHFNQHQPSEVSVRNIWSVVHTIKFKKVAGPPPAEFSSLSPPPESKSPTVSTLPVSLDKNPTTSGILRLLSMLHEMNANIDDVLSDKKEAQGFTTEPVSQFVNTKLTAKLNRQLEEPLIVASNCLPSWSEDLARLYPFLFPFETRHLFLQSTSFGYSRSMTRWQNAQSSSDARHDRHRDDRPFLGRLQRQKVRISRSRILESAIKVMELYGSSPSILEVEYFEEVGTGLGPTLEFYSTVSKEFSKKKIKLWREHESNVKDEFAFGTQGLFPAPMSEELANSENGKRVLHLFKMLGKFVARSMLDSRIIDISFNSTFFRIGDASVAVAPSLGAVKGVDAGLAKSLKLLKKFANAKKKVDENPKLNAAQKVQALQEIVIDGARVEDIGLDFTLPGYSSIEMIPNGRDVDVTIDNVTLYVEKVLDYTLGQGVQRQIDAFRAGFSLVFPYSALKAFTPDELVMLFGRVEEDWSLETLMDSVKADHGYNLDSKSVRNLLQAMSELNPSQRRDFLQFVTGSPKLPIGGFKALTPMFTVVCKPSEPPYTSDDYLPSVMTCVNYLKMPDYSTMEILRERLNVAIREGQGAFHLS